MQIKIQPISKEVLRFYNMGIVQYKPFRTFRKIINKSSEMAQASP